MSEMMNEHNAVIIKTRIEIEDDGIITAELMVRYAGGVQSFGGWNIEGQPKWLRRVIDTVGVMGWNDLVGKNLRVRGTFEKISAIGHIIEDRWFEPEKEFENNE